MKSVHKCRGASPGYMCVQCVGVLSKALGKSWKGPAASLIEPMILTGLSSTLVQSLQVKGLLKTSTSCP